MALAMTERSEPKCVSAGKAEQKTNSTLPKTRADPALSQIGTELATSRKKRAGGSATEERHSTANDQKPEPKDAKPKKNPNNLYSITSLLIEPPQPPMPTEPSATPPTPPPPPKPPAKPGPRLHPIIEYWGLH